ncbi:MAG: L,D-transpeptidase family protein [Acidimicrobiales bacterium]
MSASATTPGAATTGTIASPPATNTPDMTRAQQLLLTQGFDVGPIDGSAGPATKAAISAFQAKMARPVTGQLDGETFKALLDAAVEVADQLPVSVTVDLSDQRVLVYNALGQLITYWPVSTGGPGNETPTGTFAVDSRQLVGTASSDYRVHMDFFTVFNGGIGFHGIPWVSNRDNRLWTPLGEYGVSHGCIRMEDANAEYLYSFLPDGAPVVVQD